MKIAGRNIDNLRYADDTTLLAESEEELKGLLMKVKVESDGLYMQSCSWQMVSSAVCLVLLYTVQIWCILCHCCIFIFAQLLTA